jgi:hypothetical protein
MLLRASLRDWLPMGPLADFISDPIHALDLKAFYVRDAGGGARRIERPLHEDLAFRMQDAGHLTQHRTIRDLRCLHCLELSDLFVQVVKLGPVAIDGTKIKANAGRFRGDERRAQPPRRRRVHAARRGRQPQGWTLQARVRPRPLGRAGMLNEP